MSTDTTETTALSERIDLVESHIAIENLIATYAKGFDTQDPDTLHTIWHDDAVIDFGDSFGRHEGIEAIRTAAEGFWQAITWMHHWQATPLIAISGDNATSYVGLDCMVRSAEQGPVRVGGYYEDKFERRNGEWKFSERKCDLQFWVPDPNWKSDFGSHP